MPVYRMISFIIIISCLFISCAGLPTNFERSETYAFSDTGDTKFGKVVSVDSTMHPGKSGFLLLGNGLDAFVARAILCAGAERSIDVQYYLYHDDLVGRLFTYQLVLAADSGVRVRLLVDDMGLADRDLGVSVMDSHPNIEVRIFNPFSRKTGRISQFITRMGSVTRRMHNKSFTVDNQMAILGGRNIGDEYFDADPDLAFADLDVLTIGPAVYRISTAFDLYWNSELAYPATVLRGKSPTPEEIRDKRQQLDAFVADQQNSQYMESLRTSGLADNLRNSEVRFTWGEADVVYDEPEKILLDTEERGYHLAPQLGPYFAGVQEELIIFSPYFVPGKAGTKMLTDLAHRGVKVRIVTNSLASNDVGVVHSGYSKYRKPLLRGGVELYEMNKKLTRAQRKEKKGRGKVGSSKASLHAKSFVFDRERVFIGSLNLDPRALVQNTEIGMVMKSSKIGSDMGVVFDQFVKQAAFRLELVKKPNGSEKLLWHGLVDGEAQTFDVDPYTSFWRRFGIGFMRFMPIESQL